MPCTAQPCRLSPERPSPPWQTLPWWIPCRLLGETALSPPYQVSQHRCHGTQRTCHSAHEHIHPLPIGVCFRHLQSHLESLGVFPAVHCHIPHAKMGWLIKLPLNRNCLFSWAEKHSEAVADSICAFQSSATPCLLYLEPFGFPHGTEPPAAWGIWFCWDLALVAMFLLRQHQGRAVPAFTVSPLPFQIRPSCRIQSAQPRVLARKKLKRVGGFEIKAYLWF